MKLLELIKNKISNKNVAVIDESVLVNAVKDLRKWEKENGFTREAKYIDFDALNNNHKLLVEQAKENKFNFSSLDDEIIEMTESNTLDDDFTNWFNDSKTECFSIN